MPSQTTTRNTVLEIVNEVRDKLGLKQVTALTDDSQASTLVKYLNDVLAEITDYGDWQELLEEVTVTASVSVFDYTINTPTSGRVVQNVKEVAFTNDIAPMRLNTIEDIRRLQRTTNSGEPRQWTLIGVDSTTTNPIMRVYPTPGSNQNNETFDVLIYTKLTPYTTSAASETPPFPSRMVVSGLLAKALLDESRGTPTQDYLTEYQNFRNLLGETWNRYNGDSGTDTYFRPSYSRSRR